MLLSSDEYREDLRCRYCLEPRRDHVEDKCLYGPERFVRLHCAYAYCHWKLMTEKHLVATAPTVEGFYHVNCIANGLKMGATYTIVSRAARR